MIKNYRVTMELDIAVEVDNPEDEYLDFGVLEAVSQGMVLDWDDTTDFGGVRIVALSEADITRIDRVEDGVQTD